MEQVDVLIVGAGLSGVGLASHLNMRLPGKRYTILEGREAIGGTWDLFRYPGVRSDSDMYTLGYRFKPWEGAKSIADGPSILAYVTETARENGVEAHIRFGHRVVRADWSTEAACWTVVAEHRDRMVEIRANFVVLCAGYYRYDEGHRPEWPGEGDFAGRIVHPQHWPDALDYAGKRVVVIGSGATAVTLVPELAKAAAHVTMLQRSPTYVVSRPAEDAWALAMRRHLPARLAYALTRWKNLLLGQLFFRLARRRPARVSERLIGMVRHWLGPDYDVATHFTPRYNPWDQRLCLIPDADLFKSIKSGASSVVTDTIERFTPQGIRLASGTELPADVIVTATGLALNIFGDVALHVDGRAIDPATALIYKGMMLGDVPNLGFVFGYTNASWTLKADLTSEYLCRLIARMDRRGMAIAVPRQTPGVVAEPFIDFSSGYVARAASILPKQGTKRPWRLNQNYALDLLALRYGKIADGTMTFSGRLRPSG